MSKPTPISGFLEWLPAQRYTEQLVLDIIREVFELHGFEPINTRAVEPVERLTGKGGDADKEIYAVSRLAADESDAKEAGLGLHFDLTVPFARYVLENSGKLTFPFRRYQIQPVWRGERPQAGRYREFVQADIDIVDVGELPFHYEVELPLVIADVFKRLPIGEFRIQVNNRKIPEGFYRGLGIDDIVGTLRIVDKLDKIGAEKVAELLVANGLTDDQAEQCLALAEISSPDGSFVERVRALGVEHPTLDEGLEHLASVIATASEHAPGVAVADLRIARVLECSHIDGSDKLLRFKLDVGELGARDVFSGIKAYYQPEDLVGKMVVYVANLAPRKMRFGTSTGMILSASGDGQLHLLQPGDGVKPGMKIG